MLLQKLENKGLKVVWALLEARTQSHLCEIADTRGFREMEQRTTEKERRDNVNEDMKKYQPIEYMTQYGKWMSKIMAGPA